MRLLVGILLACAVPIFADPPEENLTLSMNIGQGAILELSNGKSYKIDPEHRIYSAYWITPFAVKLEASNDPNYPVKITNLSSNTSVNGVEVNTEEILQENTPSPSPYETQPSPPRTQPKPSSKPSSQEQKKQ